MTEQETLKLEDKIPLLAEAALKNAYEKALESEKSVLIVEDGWLIQRQNGFEDIYIRQVSNKKLDNYLHVN